MSPFHVPAVWRLSTEVFRLSFSEMASDGIRGCEGVALWLGRRNNAAAVITHVVALRGPGVTKRPDYLSISPELMNDVTDVAIDNNAYLVGQIHSHPTGYGVDLSEADKRYGVSVPGFLSVVAPDFAASLGARPEFCGFHLFEDGRWRRFSDRERRVRIQNLTGIRTPLLVVGGAA